MDYDSGYIDGYYAAKHRRLGSPVINLFRLFFSLTWAAFTYLPLLLFGYWLSTKLQQMYSIDPIAKIALTLAFAYVALGFIYFLKGLIIALRLQQKKLWMLVWIACIILTCGFQFFIIQYNVEAFFDNRQINNGPLWGWIVAFIISFFIYSHYKFLTNVAPRVVFLCFKYGFEAVNRMEKVHAVNSVARKSSSVISNTLLKVSYRKA